MTVSRARKRDLAAGKSKQGKGTKIMAVATVANLRLGGKVDTASSHENQLLCGAIAGGPFDELPARLMEDKAYDSLTRYESYVDHFLGMVRSWLHTDYAQTFMRLVLVHVGWTPLDPSIASRAREALQRLYWLWVPSRVTNV